MKTIRKVTLKGNRFSPVKCDRPIEDSEWRYNLDSVEINIGFKFTSNCVALVSGKYVISNYRLEELRKLTGAKLPVDPKRLDATNLSAEEIKQFIEESFNGKSWALCFYSSDVSGDKEKLYSIEFSGSELRNKITGFSN